MAVWNLDLCTVLYCTVPRLIYLLVILSLTHYWNWIRSFQADHKPLIAVSFVFCRRGVSVHDGIQIITYNVERGRTDTCTVQQSRLSMRSLNQSFEKTKSNFTWQLSRMFEALQEGRSSYGNLGWVHYLWCWVWPMCVYHLFQCMWALCVLLAAV